MYLLMGGCVCVCLFVFGDCARRAKISRMLTLCFVCFRPL
jgi:hypothetical protein